jgi:cold shock CspA family protein
MSSSETSGTESTSYVGQVKWFNNRLGYGFITIISQGDRHNEDIFVHQQHITPKTSDYRSLQQGEYVSFQLGTADSSASGNAEASSESAKHINQAVNVTGVFGGTLMCDQIPRRTPGQPGTGSSSRKPESGSTTTHSEVPRGGMSGRGRGRSTGTGVGRGGRSYTNSKPE